MAYLVDNNASSAAAASGSSSIGSSSASSSRLVSDAMLRVLVTSTGMLPSGNLTTLELRDTVNDTNFTELDGNRTNTSSDGISAATILVTMAVATVMGAAVFGNFLVIISVFRFEKLRIIANSFIVSLAFADLLVAIVVMPFSASQAIAGRWVFGIVMCDIFNANDVMFSTASLLHLCCISMDRYIAIMDPFHYESKMTKKRVAVMLVCAWGAAALISHVPIHLGWYTTAEHWVMHHSIQDECVFIVNKIYAVISSTISFWMPTFIMVFVYVKIYRTAKRQEKQIHILIPLNTPNGAGGATENHSMAPDRRKMKREHKAAKTLGIIMGAYLCCWLPFFIWYLTESLCDPCETPEIIINILFWIGYFNSALNPTIYAFFNRDFRNAFKKLLRLDRKWRCGSERRESDSLTLTYVSDLRHKSVRQNHNHNGLQTPRKTYQTVD